ncbi:MAG: hypothetical protein DYG83_02330 [Candidatus Brocadia sp. AMX2]|uniref:Uncharacterized protein n=1 Tax=Candidatus Brocadia sinica JPN1 TaxID=1197129 RepID=A0ABQ0JUZ5_9BACT|nr:MULTISPECIES: hypothetical protein [Brocadia]KXK32860.1 MAG: hypothetical protein UZ01_00282 [Candidatus Brocadia sinica]MBC6930879.1 hypothetical protein [Candidatus Brocadia sp.]MBL1167870.1 hypothetical protein [Candidatus Brocadia sp. AMX1]NOG41563.1 hypothetical protein [Planctomycetota bacterium]KAA0245407.1 MAG: hypothetical protein EDM70_03320 [Candidatus Brocadia sp. AMX2]
MIKLQIESDTTDNVLDIIKTAISAEIKRLEIGLCKTNEQIKKFETEYNVSSETFQKEFTAENLKKGDQEYIEWAGELKIKEKIMADLKKLKEIEYVAC